MSEVARLPQAWQAAETAMDSVRTFESFFEDEMERLLRALSVITGSRTEAEDIAQDAFIRIYERWDQVRTMENPSGYLYRTALNGFRNETRRASQVVRRAVGLGPVGTCSRRSMTATSPSRSSARCRPVNVPPSC